MHKLKMISGLLISLGGLFSAVQFFFIYSSLDSYEFTGIGIVFPFFPIIEVTFGLFDIISGLFHTGYILYTTIVIFTAIVVFFLGIIMLIKPLLSVAIIAIILSLFLGSFIPLLLAFSGGIMGSCAIIQERHDVQREREGDESSA
ncbi:hypothetical protein [Oceanobacillus sp. CFH 90083]|uniref:hypothetical protein n=1 Tax=Oceanobacillus sp. CFH 90083 TaxID=2592336 RepID=UPI00128BF51A|nr:hypothetical protein [Oceanobacillus sp. CFH 90083]